ncbi:FGGY-family carbohydrate kinase [Streptomyces sp. RTd22]|uniref:FGGY-family carbohydrate kinase n=1 Tax=Streptomyces sp. RTd22 TaxID=1841249 RepID=UPI0007C4CF87|nr:FGGY-family carbohydrate kinase [Streptomyces sp. RTd22]
MRMIIGVDVGTSVTKAVAFDRDGVAHASAARPSRLDRLPGGRVEQDLEDVLRTVAEVVREVAAALPGPPAALALTGQGDGLWLRDEAGRAVRPPISWLDGRGGATIARWRADGTLKALYALTGSGLFPGCHAPLLHWLAEHEPEALERAAVAGYCVDAVAQRLTGVITVDASDASLPFLDVTTRTYVPDALERCGLSGYARLLPEPAAPGAVLALDDEGARLTGLPPGLPVVSGPYDLPGCAIGSGVRDVGDGLLIVGTTLACQVLTDRAAVDISADPAGMWLCTPDPERWLRAMPAMVGTAALEWVLDLTGTTTAELDALLDASPPGANGVTALPFLSGAGERAPFVEPAAQGRLDGLTLATTRADTVRAVCEAIAYAARHCLEAAGLSGRLALCGGGVRSAAWTEIFANVIGRPVVIPDEPEVGARGAVAVAWRSLGDPVDASRWRSASRTVEPRSELRGAYVDGYAGYRDRLARALDEWRTSGPAS